ncbi:MAG: hypothetical protein KGZ83_15370 [Sulfuricella sp.]|nr:hypothetical protein [Sulfuricella sp.]
MPQESITRVVLLTGHYRIVGNIELYPGARLTDYLGEAKEFFAITDAEVWDFNGRKVASANFMDINRAHVEVIMPEQAVTQGIGKPNIG